MKSSPHVNWQYEIIMVSERERGRRDMNICGLGTNEGFQESTFWCPFEKCIFSLQTYPKYKHASKVLTIPQ